MKLTEGQKASIMGVIGDPVHSCGAYEDWMIPALWSEIENIMNNFAEGDSRFQNVDIIDRINDYVKSNVSIRTEYFSFVEGSEEKFDNRELFFRTALAAFQRRQAVCAGFIEATRCLLAAYGYKSYTLISKLPGANKQLLHYVCVVEKENGEYKVLDPEREGNCERKGYDFYRYLNGMTFIIPGADFCAEKIGSTGLGIKASDYLSRSTTVCCDGVSEIGNLIRTMEVKGNAK